MAVQDYIQQKHIPYLFEYFKLTGWTIQKPRSYSEVFRAIRRDHRRPVILYRMNGTQFLSADNRDMKILTKFIMWYNTKGEKTMKTMETRVEEMEKAIEEIRAVLGMTESSATPAPQKNQDTGLTLKQKVTNLIHEIGVPAHIKGYGYVREAILMTIKNPSIINSITYRLYPQIAETFQTTPARVERAIRHAIEVAWTNGDMDTLTGMFGYTISNTKGKPTNSQFIALLADRFLIEEKEDEMD